MRREEEVREELNRLISLDNDEDPIIKFAIYSIKWILGDDIEEEPIVIVKEP